MARVYLPAVEAMFLGGIDLENDTIKACLVETGCTFTETHATLSAVLAVGGGEFEADSGYSRQTLGSPNISIASGKVKFTSSNVQFASVDSGDTAIAMVIFYDPGTGDGNCIPICYADGADEVFTDDNVKTLTYACPSDGWFYVSNV